jgi:hypothetical protein
MRYNLFIEIEQRGEIMETAITVNFPKPVYQRLQRQAKVMRTPISEIVVQTIKQSLPAWLDVIPIEHERQLAKLHDLSDSQLEKFAKSKLSIAKQRKLDKLLQKNSEGQLTSRELDELDNLHLEANFLTLKKAQALVILKERGCKSPLSKTKEVKR